MARGWGTPQNFFEIGAGLGTDRETMVDFTVGTNAFVRILNLSAVPRCTFGLITQIGYLTRSRHNRLAVGMPMSQEDLVCWSGPLEVVADKLRASIFGLPTTDQLELKGAYRAWHP